VQKIWTNFLEWEKLALRKIFRHFLHTNFFMFVLLISNHTVFLVQFGINWHLWVFQKAHSCKLIPNWTQNCMITYTYHNLCFVIIRIELFSVDCRKTKTKAITQPISDCSITKTKTKVITWQVIAFTTQLKTTLTT